MNAERTTSESQPDCATVARVRSTSSSIASTILGGALFGFIGFYLYGTVPWLGEPLMWAGAGAWAFGCLWLVAYCRGRSESVLALLWLNLTGLPAFVGLLMLLGPIGSPHYVWLVDAVRQQIPEWFVAIFDEGLKYAVEALFGGLFWWQCARLNGIAMRARAEHETPRPRRWVIPPPDAGDVTAH